MGWRKLLLTGIALSFIILLPQPSLGASLSAVGDGVRATIKPQLRRVVFGHSSRGTSYYCYPRNYWWFYRPYTTAQGGYARCMPYFHYLPQAHKGRARGDVK